MKNKGKFGDVVVFYLLTKTLAFLLLFVELLIALTNFQRAFMLQKGS